MKKDLFPRCLLLVVLPTLLVLEVSCSSDESLPSPDGVVASGDSQLRAPDGFRPVRGSSAEPYTDTGWAAEVTHEKTGIAMVFIPAGRFEMGSPKAVRDSSDDERPVHTVRITKPFYLGKFEVTQDQWTRVMGDWSFAFKGGDSPAESVSWNDCQDFFAAAGGQLRLPTEAEWEYACRAGSSTAYSFGDSPSSLGDYAWHAGNSGRKSHPVGRKKPNAWGLYDMYGNVFEWCQDWCDLGYYERSPVDDPPGGDPGSLSYRVVRGGSWTHGDVGPRSANRSGLDPKTRSLSDGLRVARSLE